MNLFKFIAEDGEVEFVSAKNKKNAIEEFCRDFDLRKDYVKKNYEIIDLGYDEG